MAARSSKNDRSREVQPQPPRPPHPSKPSTPPRRPSRIDIDQATSGTRAPKKRTRVMETEADEPLSASEPAAVEDEHDFEEVTPPKKSLRRLRRMTHREPEQPKTPARRGAVEATPKMSLLDAAALLISRLSPKELAAGISATELCDRIIADGMWQSAGRTPHMSLYSAMNKEHMYRGDDSRFERIGPNLFTAGPALKRGKRSAKPDDQSSTPPSAGRSRGKKSTREGRGGEA